MKFSELENGQAFTIVGGKDQLEKWKCGNSRYAPYKGSACSSRYIDPNTDVELFNEQGEASEPTWADKIAAIQLAANWHSDAIRRKAEQCLRRGESHMEYKDWKEFDCECPEQYIFQEAEFLIEEYRLPFNMALSVAVNDRIRTAELKAELEAEQALKPSSSKARIGDKN